MQHYPLLSLLGDEVTTSGFNHVQKHHTTWKTKDSHMKKEGKEPKKKEKKLMKNTYIEWKFRILTFFCI
jgi:hypothetical protein